MMMTALPSAADFPRLHERVMTLAKVADRAREERDSAARVVAELVTDAPDRPASPAAIDRYVAAREAADVAWRAYVAAHEARAAAREAFDATQGRGRRSEVDA